MSEDLQTTHDQDPGWPAITEALEQLREADPELVEALEAARAVSRKTLHPYGNREDLHTPEKRDEDPWLHITHVPSLEPLWSGDENPGLLDIVAGTSSEKDGKGNDATVVGRFKVDEKGKILKHDVSTHGFVHPDGDAVRMEMEDADDDTEGPLLDADNRDLSHHTGDPAKVRQYVIDTAHQVAEIASRQNEAAQTAAAAPVA